MNKLTYFLEWLTYNPDNIPVEEIVQQAMWGFVSMWLFCSVVSYIVILIMTKFKLTFKHWVYALLVIPPYGIVTFLWSWCFYSDNWLVYFMPVYPLILIWMIRKFIKTIKNRRAQYES